MEFVTAQAAAVLFATGRQPARDIIATERAGGPIVGLDMRLREGAKIGERGIYLKNTK